MSDPDKGLMVKVYRTVDERDCTNGGASATVGGFTVIGAVRTREQRDARAFEPLPRFSRVFVPDERHPAAVLVLSNLRGGPPHLVPLELYESGQWTMFGGNLADFSDGRWGELVSSFQPEARAAKLYLSSTVGIHDRVEN